MLAILNEELPKFTAIPDTQYPFYHSVFGSTYGITTIDRPQVRAFLIDLVYRTTFSVMGGITDDSSDAARAAYVKACDTYPTQPEIASYIRSQYNH